MKWKPESALAAIDALGNLIDEMEEGEEARIAPPGYTKCQDRYLMMEIRDLKRTRKKVMAIGSWMAS